MTDVTKYTQQLIFALRMRDVPGEAIGDIIAQVESHVSDTGEDPVTAFGTAREYAASFGTPASPARRWSWLLVNAVIGAALATLLVLGVFGQIRGEQVLGALSPLVAIAIGALGIIGYFTLTTVFWANRITDPRKQR